MSHSTTLTATHVLTKYAKSSGTGASEFQYFVNPVLKVLLDVTRSPASELTSVRLRVVWYLDGVAHGAGANAMDVDHREVVLEDLELLAFSSVPQPQHSKATKAQGLPLKAVYRDLQVGIRYLHPIGKSSDTSPPTYRRFQMNFESGTAVLQFIDAIRNVCPCQPYDIPPAGSVRAGQHVTPALARINSRMQPPSASGTTTHTIAPDQLSSSLSVGPREILTPLPSSTPTHTTSSPIPRPISSSASVQLPSMPVQTPRGHCDSQDFSTHLLGGPSQISSANTSLPSSSQLSASNSSSNIMPPPPIPSLASRVPTPSSQTYPSALVSERMLGLRDNSDTPSPQFQGLLDSLKETSILYGLSQIELENVVSQVVCEDGFVELLEAMDKLWRVKGFLGRD